MSLSEYLEQEKVKPRRCITCNWYDSLDDNDKKSFDEYADGWAEGKPGFQIATLWRACVNSGLTATRQPFTEHLKRCYVTK